VTLKLKLREVSFQLTSAECMYKKHAVRDTNTSDAVFEMPPSPT